MTSKNITPKTRSRLTIASRVLAATLVSGILFTAPLSPAWALKKAAANKDVIPQSSGESYVGAYFIVIGGIMVGLTAVCRKSQRTTEVKRPGGGGQ